MNTQKNFIPKEMFDKPARIIHNLGENEYGVEQIETYFGKIIKRNNKTQELTLKVFLWAERNGNIPKFKELIVKDSEIEVSFLITRINAQNIPQTRYQKWA